jgi:hypothetical protein
MKAWRDPGDPLDPYQIPEITWIMSMSVILWIRTAKTRITLIPYTKLDVTARQARPYVCI